VLIFVCFFVSLVSTTGFPQKAFVPFCACDASFVFHLFLWLNFISIDDAGMGADKNFTARHSCTVFKRTTVVVLSPPFPPRTHTVGFNK
jgi:hypothetical protein